MEEQLEEIERSGGDGSLRVARGKTLELSNLDKVYFPAIGATKGELMRYYARIAPYILPLTADRPLVLKRSPEGVDGEIFFQQKPPARTPAGVRIEAIPARAQGDRGATPRATPKTRREGDQGKAANGGSAKRRAKPPVPGRASDGNAEPRIVGGELTTLLYTVQLGCISVDPWFSRVGRMPYPDYAILDLDPGPEAGFAEVIRAARLVHAELERLGVRAALKSSGSRGLHIALPLPRQTTYDESLALAERIAKRVASQHPEAATVERSLADRPPAAVYIDYLQNARGKSVACAYCARARAGATVSAPLAWSELRDALDPGAFTIRSLPARLADVGDIWRDAMRRGNPRKVVKSVLSAEG